jgi:hypothetical protein
MTLDELDALLGCRRERERQAEEALGGALAASEIAERAAARARHASTMHQRMRRGREAALYQGLQGRRVAIGELDRVNARLAELAATTARLEARVAEAQAEQRRAEERVARARSVLAAHRRNHAKLDALFREVEGGLRREAELREDVDAEELVGDRPGPRRPSWRRS